MANALSYRVFLRFLTYVYNFVFSLCVLLQLVDCVYFVVVFVPCVLFGFAKCLGTMIIWFVSKKQEEKGFFLHYLLLNFALQ